MKVFFSLFETSLQIPFKKCFSELGTFSVTITHEVERGSNVDQHF